MRVTCIQTNPQNNFEENIKQIKIEILKASNQGAQVCVLPEMFSYMGAESTRKVTKNKIMEGTFLDLQNLSRELGVYLVAGSHSETCLQNEEKVYNSSLTFSPQGGIISHYRKLHLFNLRDGAGKKLYCESDVFEEGEMPQPYSLNIDGESWNALTIICYDLRFPEIIRKQPNNIDILFVPAAFTWQTGKDHWEILLRARAIENQCYVVACNQTGFFFNNEKRNYGHSMIIDPWGTIISKIEENVGQISAQLPKEKLKEFRSKLPALADKKIKL